MMEGPAPPRLRRQVSIVLFAGLGILLAILVSLGLYANRSLNDLVRREQTDVWHYLRQADQVRLIRHHLLAATNKVHRCLIEEDETGLARRRVEARVGWAEAVAAVRDHRQAAPEWSSLVDSLTSQMDSYWAAAEPALNLEGADRRAAAIPSQVRQLASMSDAMLETVNDLAQRAHEQLILEANVAEERARRVDNWLWIAIGVASALALAVATATFRDVMGLERLAEQDYHRALRASAELERLSGQLLTSHEEERKRIARDLHDDYGQRMASLLFELSSAADRCDPESPLKPALQSAVDRLGNLARDLQLMSRSLHSAVLDKIGLEGALRSECSGLSQRSPIEVRFTASGVPRQLSEETALVLYRVFQEAMQNAVKHSEAKRVDVSLVAVDGQVALKVQDDGKGFDPHESPEQGGLGLISMRERLRLIDGDMAIDSRPGKGTTVSVSAPIGAPAAA